MPRLSNRLANALLALLALASSTAFAQTPPLPTSPLPPQQAVAGESAEQAFARGYQRGWADAAERAQQRSRQARPRACMRVKVLDAVWAGERGGCDATRAVSELANGRGTASVPATNMLCGDPAPGRSKTLAVEFGCGEPGYCGNEIRTASAREGSTLQLACAP
jgi:hypothetical protein